MIPVIRKATKEDINKIAEIHTKSWQKTYHNILKPEFLNGPIVKNRMEYWENNFKKGNQLVFIAEIDHQAIGFICIHPEDPNDTTFLNEKYPQSQSGQRILIDNFHVLAPHNDKGIGSKLLKASMLEIQQQSLNYKNNALVYLWAYSANDKSCAYYTRMEAKNAGEQNYKSPDGGTYPATCFTWDNCNVLLDVLQRKEDMISNRLEMAPSCFFKQSNNTENATEQTYNNTKDIVGRCTI